MTGYAMSNYLLAVEFEKAGIVPPKMKAVITSSEKLTDKMRKTLEREFTIVKCLIHTVVSKPAV